VVIEFVVCSLAVVIGGYLVAGSMVFGVDYRTPWSVYCDVEKTATFEN